MSYDAPQGAVVEIQFRDQRDQADTALGGMWLFLASELLFFGALFLAWEFCRVQHMQAFAATTRETEFAIGTANTAVLLTSSFVFACAVLFARAGKHRRVAQASLLTALLGIAFLALKAVEWREDILAGDVPGASFRAPGEGGEQLFWILYWTATILHALHLIVGVGLVCWIAWRARQGRLRNSTPVEIVGLYWSFVDMIWLVVYPLIYLAGRGG